MMDEARSRAAPLDCHDERGDGEFGTDVLTHGPANHLAGEQFEDHQRRELEAIFSGKKGGLFEGLWGAVISSWLPTETTQLRSDGATRRSSVSEVSDKRR